MFETERNQAEAAVRELIDLAGLKTGSVLVIGCSSSEIIGECIGKGSSVEAAESITEGIFPVLREKGIFLAAQCCEHLNRALIIERELAEKLNLEIVNVLPKPKAGGSFATAVYNSFSSPVAVEHIRADAGIDIGDTLIGMHLKEVAVPVRLHVRKIGQANVVAARTRPRFIGGARANYNDSLM